MPEPTIEDTSIEKQKEYLQECISDKTGIDAAIVNTLTQTTIGTISLSSMDTHHRFGELGIVIGDRNYWGKGYASAAVGLFLGYIKENTNIQRIIAESEKANIGIQKVMEKNGFEVECVCNGGWVKNNVRVDTVRMVTFL